MSDDEYYEDDDDWYWYEDDYTGIGDDLAATAVYSPIMVEDPSLEVVETFSDWEYYSDDYYDDDPSIINKQGTEGQTDGPPRKKKRKLSSQQEQQNVPPLSLGPAVVDSDSGSSPTDANSFKGVLWRPPSVLGQEKITLYEPGKGEKVALLSDWREVFKTSLIRKDWFQNGDDQPNGEQLDRVVREATPEGPENGGGGNRYATYSPPPLEIDDMDKSILRQREKNIQSEQGMPQSNLREMMVVGDSEEEPEEPEEPENLEAEVTAPVVEAALVEESTAPAEEDVHMEQQKEPEEPEAEEAARVVEDVHMEQQEEQAEKPEPTTRKEMLSVEVPAPSNITNPPPRKRGRKPKASSSSSSSKPHSPVTTSNNKPLSNPKKRGLQTDENDEHDSKRRSRRIASVSEPQPEQKKSNRGRKKKTT